MVGGGGVVWGWGGVGGGGGGGSPNSDLILYSFFVPCSTKR